MPCSILVNWVYLYSGVPGKFVTQKKMSAPTQRELLLLLLASQKKKREGQLADPLMAVLAYQQRMRQHMLPPSGDEAALRLETANNLKRFASLMAMLRGSKSSKRRSGARSHSSRLRDLQCMNCMAQDANRALEALLNVKQNEA
jgi:hypothetical protein